MLNIDQLITRIHALKTQDITHLFHDIKLVLTSADTQAINRLSSVNIELNGQQGNVLSLYVEQGESLQACRYLVIDSGTSKSPK
ncbi:MAG: hypothetical protein K0U24_04710 [Gammaproteobacteria bacterium]|nr:hypothetical protein [Gammaproteobacteria bacterium]MCH9763517.1 hypothetical protein [Gammaproteobacteria bacterium]